MSSIKRRIKPYIIMIAAILMVLGMVGSASAVDEKMLERMEQLIKEQQGSDRGAGQGLGKAAATGGGPLRKGCSGGHRSGQSRSRQNGCALERGFLPLATRSRCRYTARSTMAFMTADDGDSSDYYVVDNDNSSSRMGIIATARPLRM